MSIRGEAIRDAHEYALAKMFYGEGAGIRRRLINQTVQFKIANVPGYSEAFQRELARQDFAKISRKARRERRRIDTLSMASKNARALLRGDYRAMSVPLVVIAGGAYVAHQTGYDKKALAHTKVQYRKTKRWVGEKRSQWKHRNDPTVVELGPSGPIAQ